MFEPITYFTNLHTKHKTLAEKYKLCRVSGVAALEEVLEGAKRENFFFAIDDAEDGITFRGGGGGYFIRKSYTVFILGKCKYGDMDTRQTILTEARAIFRSLLSKIIKDKLIIPVLNAENIRFFEVPPAFAFGTSGIYFIFTVENPVDLRYDAGEWED